MVGFIEDQMMCAGFVLISVLSSVFLGEKLGLLYKLLVVQQKLDVGEVINVKGFSVKAELED